MIDPTIDLQATEVQCQAFLGFLLQEISKNTTLIYNLKDALHKFCPRYFQLKIILFFVFYKYFNRDNNIQIIKYIKSNICNNIT